ncbi:MAG: hypothetical protein BGO78_02950 [Chloroflexi bacterium 44-23]|nr:MAG: hypothetical protein BGO78_02950 [Chloroflexi bacterium 44-23]
MFCEKSALINNVEIMRLVLPLCKISKRFHKLDAPLLATQNDLRMNGRHLLTFILIFQSYFSPSKHSSFSPFLTFADWIVIASLRC